MNAAAALGVDFGSSSVRALIMDLRSGEELGAAVKDYPSGNAGILSDPADANVARQHPGDFLSTLETVVRDALADAKRAAGTSPEQVVGIGVDGTGSTPIPVDAAMQPLALRPEFASNLNAQAWMWKDHSSLDEAEQITALASEHRPHFLRQCGGAYSSEWLLAKAWHCLNVDPEVFQAAHAWVELSDFVPAVLAGLARPEDVPRNVCAAGHKAMYAAEWGGFPDAEFLGLAAPAMALLQPRLGSSVLPIGARVGGLCEEHAGKLGLKAGTPVSMGALDAHMGAVGAGVGHERMVRVIGTSSCDILVAPATSALPDIPGVCGVALGSVIPDFFGIEAGQSAVGDIFNWFVTVFCGGSANKFAELTAAAAAYAPGQTGLLGLDWHNGNRCVLVDARLSGLLVGLSLQTPPAAVFRAWLEASAFGARIILERLEEYGVCVNEIVNCGGIAEKNPLFMQILADVLGRPMRFAASSQTCAAGANFAAAVAAGPENGGYSSIPEAQSALCRFKDTAYSPSSQAQATYNELFGLYRELHDSFGIPDQSFDHYLVMKKLLEIQKRARD